MVAEQSAPGAEQLRKEKTFAFVVKFSPSRLTSKRRLRSMPTSGDVQLIRPSSRNMPGTIAWYAGVSSGAVANRHWIAPVLLKVAPCTTTMLPPVIGPAYGRA